LFHKLRHSTINVTLFKACFVVFLVIMADLQYIAAHRSAGTQTYALFALVAAFQSLSAVVVDIPAWCCRIPANAGDQQPHQALELALPVYRQKDM
jgi:hypothetical protein